MLRSTMIRFLSVLALAIASTGLRGEPPESMTAKAIAAGEFQWAKGIASNKDNLLAEIATAQSLSGETAAAAATLRGIESASAQSSVVNDTWSSLQGGAEAGGAGGGAFADFDSLMNLIQTTVMPDTWEALGGNSTMAPYPQGVFIDPSGTIRAVEQAPSTDALANLTNMLAPSAGKRRGDWRDTSALRVVSLRRLRDAMTQRRLARLPLGDAMLHLAGLTQIDYVVMTDDDILLAAPVGGIQETRGWFVDAATGRTTLRTDHLARCFAATNAGLAFGCTIDPTPAGMQAAASVSAKISRGQIPIGTAADELRNALGMQRVEVFGAAADTSVALLMVEADRHMKQLAMGDASMPDGVDNYLDIVDELIEFGPPNGLLLRLWFTSAAQKVRSDSDSRVFEISGTPIRLSGENQRALADGGRGNVTVDIRSQRFVEEFNKHWNRIRDKYPIYGSLESLYRAAAVAELIKRYSTTDSHRSLASSFAVEDESRDWPIVAPTQVESIATLHTVRKGKKRHHVLLTSDPVRRGGHHRSTASPPATDSRPRSIPRLSPVRRVRLRWRVTHDVASCLFVPCEGSLSTRPEWGPQSANRATRLPPQT
ncbi:MAG: DUF1598 domain-containing protein, partial [Planctomycetota bacterium]